MESVMGMGWRSTSIASAATASAPATRPDNGILSLPGEAAEAAKFTWTNQWYPVGFLLDLPRNAPIPFSLFDHRLVVWHHGGSDGGGWGCMSDECPHRRAPLSRGRLYRPAPGSSSRAAQQQQQQQGGGGGPQVQPVLLECSYHGWQFNAGGECVRLPQMLHPEYEKQMQQQQQQQQQQNAPGADATAAAVAAAGASCSNGTAAAAAAGSSGSSSGSSNGGQQRTAAVLRRCGGQAYRTAVAQGMLWVWWGEPEAADEAAIPLDFAEQGARAGEQWALVDVFTRDFPYDWETMVENVVDPAHVAFAHDGTGQGLDRHASPPLELQVVESGAAGFVGRFRGVRALPPASPSATTANSSGSSSSSSSSNGSSSSSSSPAFAPGAWSQLEFRAPCLVSMRFALPGKGEAGLVLYCVPLGRGRSRMVARLPRNFATGWLAGLQPRWAKHLPRMGVLDQDIDLLREQEQIMLQARLADLQQQQQQQEEEEGRSSSHGSSNGSSNGSGSSSSGAAEGAVAADAAAATAPHRLSGDWRRGYVMPAPADRFVVSFRRWLDAGPGRSRPWAAGAEAAYLAAAAAAAGGRDPLPREVVLDRYHSHVKSCNACSAALANFRRLAAAAAVAAAASAAVAAGLAAAAVAVADVSAAALWALPTSAAAAAATVPSPGPAAAVAAALAAVFALVAAWANRMAQRFVYTEEGMELRLNEDRWLRRLLFSGTNSFNSMVALTNRRPGGGGGGGGTAPTVANGNGKPAAA
ncbi:hypothetical protein HYH02_010092 [Chlamydomonas schloesseri]|uniref:Rieske domain-containing protein n=1 Tax=Chlamydomonas schloesseri TaxID=2026947 RepID=A0A835T9F1_9CHLO|nr:hypothetical protein HYH02_010092 [Chlamydomonas schloesseri]|eukprot:KAG2441249.1 hypothetical protein HYH02_010092 [Chlamydomonas schloesseri]